MPKIIKALPIIKWTDYFADLLHWTVCEINTLFSYVIRESGTVPGMASLMIRGKSYSKEHGYMERDILLRASHTNPHFKEEKSKVYC